MNKSAYYKSKIQETQEVLKTSVRLSRVYLISKLISFLIFLLLGYFAIQGQSFGWAGAAILFLGGYLFFTVKDDKLQWKLELIRNKIRTYENEIKYLEGVFTSFDAGNEFINPRHPFSYDLDIFGKDSLFQRINRTRTRYGKKILASAFQNIPTDSKEYDALIEKQEAIQELAKAEEWRTVFLSLPLAEDQNLSDFLKTLISLNTTQRRSLKKGLIAFSSGLLLLLLGLSIGGVISSFYPSFFFVIQLSISVCFSNKLLKTTQKVGKLHKLLKGYVSLLNHLSKADFTTSLNRRLAEKLVGGDGNNAQKAFRELSKIANAMDQRGNLITFILFNGFFYNDLLLLYRFENWQEENIDQIDSWLLLLGEIDMLVSMGTYCFNTPHAISAEVEKTTDFIFKAENAYHPFLSKEKAIGNDFIVDKNKFYIITGANMAGKSTFLRTLGINYVLAMNGLPVCATSFKVSFFNLFTSMRAADNLAEDTSYFKAELIRLEDLIKSCSSNAYTFLILDEILRGTNSKDKLKGSKMFLQKMTTLPVAGIIATHDLELSKLAEEEESVFYNYCFEIDLEINNPYSYKITEGVARNMNATYLLRRILNSQPQ